MDLVLCYLAPKLSDGMAIILYMIIRMLSISFGTYSSKRSHLYVGTDMFFCTSYEVRDALKMID